MADMTDVEARSTALVKTLGEGSDMRRRSTHELLVKVQDLEIARHDYKTRRMQVKEEIERIQSARKQAVTEALQLSASAEQGKQVLIAIQETLAQQRGDLRAVQEELSKERSKRVTVQRSLHELLNKQKHLEVMYTAALSNRDHIQAKLDALPYKQATENATKLRRQLKTVEGEATKVSDTMVQRKVALQRIVRESGVVTTALTKARDQVNTLNGTCTDLLREQASLADTLAHEKKALIASKEKADALHQHHHLTKEKIENTKSKKEYMESETALLEVDIRNYGERRRALRAAQEKNKQPLFDLPASPLHPGPDDDQVGDGSKVALSEGQGPTMWGQVNFEDLQL